MAKTLEQLLSLSTIIANETKAGANTALRVGGLFSDIIYYLRDLNYADKDDIPSLEGYATEQWVFGKGYATTSDLDNRIDALVNGAPAAYDTLKEIADVLANNINSIDDILTALGTKVSKDDFNTAIANVNNSISALNTELSGKIDLKLDAITFNELFEKVQLEDGTWAIKAKLGLFSDGFISAKGSNVGGTSSEGGAVTLYQLNDVLADGTQVSGAKDGAVFVYDGKLGKWKGIAQSEIVPNLTGYATESWVLQQGFLTEHQDLSDYAKLSDIPAIPTTDINKGVTAYGWGDHSKVGYLTTHQSLDGYVNEIATSGNGNAITSVTKNGKKITFTKGATYLTGITSKLVTDALGYTPYDAANFTKAKIKSTLGISDWALASSKPSYTTKEVSEDTNLYFTNARAVAALKSITDGLSGNISTLQGFFTDGVANSALRLSDKGSYTAWGQTFFANGKPKSVSGALTDVTTITTTGMANIGGVVYSRAYNTIGNNNASFIFDKRGTNYTGIGGNGVVDTIYFGACDSNGAWITDYLQIWQFNGTIKPNKIEIGGGSIEWDETNKGFKIVGGLYTESYLSAKGANTNGGSSGGGGLITSLYRYADLGKTFSDTNNDTFNAYTINKINADLGSRISVLEGKATNVNFTQSLTSGTQIGTITIDGASKNIYAPTIPTSDINKGVTAYDWGNHANAGYAMASALSGYLPLSGGTIGANSSNPTNLVINSNDAIETAIQVSNNNVIKSVFGWWNGTGSFGTYIYNVASQKYLGIKDDGTPHYHGNTLIHEGNYTDYTYSKSTIDTKLGGYLPLSGGTLSGQLTISAYNTDVLVLNSLIGNSTATGGTYIKINYNGTKVAEIGHGWGLGTYMMANGNTIRITDNGIGYINNDTIIHSGNIGSQSVYNADRLGGKSATEYYQTYGSLPTNKDLATLQVGAYWVYENLGLSSQAKSTYSSLCVFGNAYYSTQFNVVHDASRAWLRGVYDSNSVSDWHELAFTDSNVASATKLQTARTIWGQSFNGENDVDGVLTLNYHNATRATGIEVISTSGGEASIGFTLNSSTRAVVGCYSDALNLWRADCGTCMAIPQSGNVLIGTTTDSGYKLDVVSASGGVLRLKSNDTYSGVQLEQQNGYAWFIGSDNTQELYMYYNGAHRFNLNATGNLKLGGSLWLNHGDYIANRATLVLNSNSNAADIIFKNNSTTKGSFGCWAISSRSESNYRFSIWRGEENATNATEQELFTILANGNFGFANNNPQYRVDVNGVIHSNTGIFSDGYVSAKGQNTSSDMRLKNVLNDVVLSVKDIANAPSVRFSWKNGGGIDVGSSAQYWQGLLPDAVKERDGMLEMQYANIALLSAIAIAKNVETHEERIARLEKENKELRNEINCLKYGA